MKGEIQQQKNKESFNLDSIRITVFWVFAFGFFIICLGIAPLHITALWQTSVHSETNKLHDGILGLIRVNRLELGMIVRSTLASQLNGCVVDVSQLDGVANTRLGRATSAGYGNEAVVQHLDTVGREVETL